MRKLKDALPLKLEGGQCHQQIAACLEISKGVVAKYVGPAVAAGLDWPAMQAMGEAALERHLLSTRPSIRCGLCATPSSARTTGQFAKRLKRSMRQTHRAGEKLFIDYAGLTIALTDRSRAGG